MLEVGSFENFKEYFFYFFKEELNLFSYHINNKIPLIFDLFFKNIFFMNFLNNNYYNIYYFFNLFYFFEISSLFFLTNFVYIFGHFNINILNPIIMSFFSFFYLLIFTIFFINYYIFYFIFLSYFFYLSYFFDLNLFFGDFWDYFGFLNFFSNFYFNELFYYFFFIDYILPVKIFFFNFIQTATPFKNNEIEIIFRDYFFFQEFIINKFFLKDNLFFFKLQRGLPYGLRQLDEDLGYTINMFNYGLLNNDLNLFNFFFY